MNSTTLPAATYPQSLRPQFQLGLGSAHAASLLYSVTLAAAEAGVTGIRAGSETRIRSGESSLLNVAELGFEPRFAWFGSKQEPPVKQGNATVFTSVSDLKTGKLTWSETVSADGNSFTWKVKASGDADLALTYAALAINTKDGLEGGEAEVFQADGTSKKFPLPFPIADGTKVQKVVFSGRGGQTATLTVTPPLDAHIDGNIRFKVAGEQLPAVQPAEATFVLDVGQPAKFYTSTADVPDPTDTSSWFPFTPKNETTPGALGMQSWMKIPSAFLKLDGDRILADGKPFKAWGTNIEYGDTKPEAKRAEQVARWLAKYGVNVVRQHKLSNPGWEGLGSPTSGADYDPESLQRFDYFNDQLRKNGVLYGFSPIWDLRVFDADRDKLAAYDELKQLGGDKVVTTGLVWFMKDIQDLHIAKMIKLLDHRNQYSGLRYADDPALAYVEIQNEEDAFFFTTLPFMLKYPTYKRLIGEQFSDWLAKRYGSDEKLAAEWGGGLNGMSEQRANPGESLAARNILPICNPWLLDNQAQSGTLARRLQDTAEYLLECQNNYYQRMADAIRAAGYQGPLVASNWQGGAKTGHFFNLHSDAQFGIIDRHNYLAGAEGMPDHEMHTGNPFLNSSSLSDPGSALLSTGMQQVAGRPFSMSEWLAIPPLEWAGAETAIIAIYGMGLQGWDMSYFFASNGDGFTPTLNYFGFKKFNNLTAHGIGLFPVLSRMVLRGDVKEGEVIASRRLTLDQAKKQSYDFVHSTIQKGDLKSFSGTPSYNALAIGRVLVEFVDKETASDFKDLAPYKQGDTFISTTKQLRWTAPGADQTGYITVDTAGTQGVLGFAPEKPVALGQLTLTPKNRYSVILATAMEPDRDLSNCTQALVVAIARVRNTGMKLGQGMILELGQGPTIIEPVQAQLTFKRQPKSVTPLDQDGQLMPTPLPMKGATLDLNTADSKTIYYLVNF